MNMEMVFRIEYFLTIIGFGTLSKHVEKIKIKF